MSNSTPKYDMALMKQVEAQYYADPRNKNSARKNSTSNFVGNWITPAAGSGNLGFHTANLYAPAFYDDLGLGYHTVDAYNSIKHSYLNAAKAKSKAAKVTTPATSTPLGDPSNPNPQPGTVEQEIQNILGSILSVAGTGAQSTSESDTAYQNRIDEIGKLRIRGMFNSFSGYPISPVQQQQSVQTYMPTLGGE